MIHLFLVPVGDVLSRAGLLSNADATYNFPASQWES